MILLTEPQVLAVIHASRPLQEDQRSAFLTALAAHFADQSEVGDGELGRALRELQPRYFTPPSAAEIETQRNRGRGQLPTEELLTSQDTRQLERLMKKSTGSSSRARSEFP